MHWMLWVAIILMVLGVLLLIPAFILLFSKPLTPEQLAKLKAENKTPRPAWIQWTLLGVGLVFLLVAVLLGVLSPRPKKVAKVTVESETSHEGVPIKHKKVSSYETNDEDVMPDVTDVTDDSSNLIVPSNKVVRKTTTTAVVPTTSTVTVRKPLTTPVYI